MYIYIHISLYLYVCILNTGEQIHILTYMFIHTEIRV